MLAGRNDIARLAILPHRIRTVASEPVAITLIQAIPKHAGLDEIIPRAVELGVQKIIPAITARVVIKLRDRTANQAGPRSLVRPQISAGHPAALDELRRTRGGPALPADKHTERWRKIVLAAAKQCRTAWLTEICPVVPLAEALQTAPADLRLFGSLAPETPSLKNILGAISRAAVKSIALAIGPEGDFTEAERALFAAAGFKPAGFGGRTLRVATAVIYGLSVLNYEFRQGPAEGP